VRQRCGTQPAVRKSFLFSSETHSHMLFVIVSQACYFTVTVLTVMHCTQCSYRKTNEDMSTLTTFHSLPLVTTIHELGISYEWVILKSQSLSRQHYKLIQHTQSPCSHTTTLLVVWLSGNALVSINVVTLRRARLVLGWVTVRAGKPSRYIASQLSQLSLLPSVGW